MLLLAGCDAETRPRRRGKAAVEEPAVAAPVADSSRPGGLEGRGLPRPWAAPPAPEWAAEGLPGEAWDAQTVRTTFAT